MGDPGYERASARLRASLLDGDQICDLPEPEPLIYDTLPLDGIAVLWGPSGSGKSLVALDWALHVATGREWWGREVRPGKVLYVVAEGARGTKHRYEAWRDFHGVSGASGMKWMTAPANILDPTERHVLLDIVNEVQPTLTVLDTLARHIPGGDENSSETMSQIVATLDDIKRATGGTALGVHHSGKNLDAGSRGHSSLKGALDAELSAHVTRDHGHMNVRVYAEKFKDWEDHRDLFVARMVPVGQSLVPSIEGSLTENERQALAALNGSALSWTEWHQVSGLARSTFGRAQKRLNDLGYVKQESQGWVKSQVSPL